MLPPTVEVSALAEQLCRIEHKLDLIVECLATQIGEFPLRRIDEKNHRDPITLEKVEYVMDLFKRHVVRRTSDGTGLIAPSSVLFDSPTAPVTATSGSNGEGNAE